MVGQIDENKSPEPFHWPSYTPDISPVVGIPTDDNIADALVDKTRVKRLTADKPRLTIIAKIRPLNVWTPRWAGKL